MQIRRNSGDLLYSAGKIEPCAPNGLHRFNWLCPRPRWRRPYRGDHRLAHGRTQAGHRRRLALGTALRVVVFAGSLACGLGAFVTAAGKGLVIVGGTYRDAGVGQCLLFGKLLRLLGRVFARPSPIRRIQFSHQLADADAGPSPRKRR